MSSTELRSQRLNQITHEPHARLDQLVKAQAPFASLPGYTRFVKAQYLFQTELQALYRDPQLAILIGDLPQRCRATQAAADLADLNAALPAGLPGAVQQPSQAEALGWLFVSEGSKLGAAFLIKRAEALGLSQSFGARHLGEPEGGRAAGWKSFTRMLDTLPLTAEQEAELDRGALAAFERFTVLLEHAYADAPQAETVQA
ncbi:biliverdin-producing heme oxygenase [Pseudomonas sp. DTU_2021_1001937_2_SI_NGA_ILE_001]|uniref:biliverdin-producing heme oxygenase n=1 Tax=Pseudomonas sp. DTU_2021_1001937_2_SI_NGA_ILE_001 TaxID=3077589 RepID=UPI0028FC2D83|nr:biliverdin-producing heme oxygenase [Pseudomonas sp. DTU_2021_1001937_2_SI_NGA_ILE_001]WNW13581.1 biliverdin-producing heme oxygenase [Pseudomonas sp. DTU_2021_1001937_2_SI_NGA_ILE_001]